jgi:UDP-N-acetylglucosamine 2-epimerase (non-hydrolysing)
MLGKMPNVKLIPPVNYEEFITLMRKCYFIMTDSGGVEEEAPALNKPVLVLRDLTERPEIIEMGVGELVGSNKERIISAGIKLLANEAKYKSMCKNISPYGDGHAAEKIVSVLSEKLKS